MHRRRVNNTPYAGRVTEVTGAHWLDNEGIAQRLGDDLIDADRDQPVEAALVEVFSDDALDDLPDARPADSHQRGDLALGHLLAKPRHDILEVTGMRRAGRGPRHCLQMHAAVTAAQPAQLALDHAVAATEIQVAPALQTPVMDLQARAGLSAARTDTPAPGVGGR